MLSEWLQHGFSEEFLKKALLLFRNILEARVGIVGESCEESLAHYCNVVARVSAGFLGLGPASPKLTDSIRTLAANLERKKPEAAATVLDKLRLSRL